MTLHLGVHLPGRHVACAAGGIAASLLAFARPCAAQDPLTAPASSASPAPSPSAAAGQAALDRARTAWEKGDYDVAEPLYAEAIEEGGLAPADVLDAYVHLGSVRAVLGKKASALVALKTAALLDPHFMVPPEAGKRATTLADQARHLGTKTGAPVFRVDVPRQVAAGSSTPVDVTLDAGRAALPGGRIGVAAKDPLGGSSHTAEVRAAEVVHFDLPSELSLPSATLRVRVDWLDAHANRLATAEQQVHVQPQTTTDTPPPSRSAPWPFALTASLMVGLMTGSTTTVGSTAAFGIRPGRTSSPAALRSQRAASRPTLPRDRVT